MANDKRTVTFYAVLERHRWWGKARCVALRAAAPELARGQCAVKVTLEVQDVCFEPVIDVEKIAVPVPDVLRASAKAGE